MPYDFGEKTGEKFLWAVKAPATATGSIRKPLSPSVIASMCVTFTEKVC